MALTRQVITSLHRDGSNLLGTRRLAYRIADESIVSGSLLTVESIRAAGLTCAGIVINPGAETSPDLDLVLHRIAALLRDLLALPVLEFGRSLEATGRLPAWLGGE